MAFQIIGKTTYFLWFDPGGGTDWKTIICLNSYTFNSSKNVNDASTMCGERTSPGTTDRSIDIDGVYAILPDGSQLGAADVFDLHEDETVGSWKIGKAVPAEGDVTKTGMGWFSSYSETHSGTDDSGFTATLTIDGAVTQVVTGAESV